MQDRGYIKWAPFNSLFDDKTVMNEINNKKQYVDKPILSDDQIEYLNEKIFEAYTNHIKINLFIYKNQKIINLIGFVNSININKKCITFNKTHIFFNQILKISTFFEKSN